VSSLFFAFLALVQGAAVTLQGATNAALRDHVGLGAAMVTNTLPIILAAFLLAATDGSLPRLADLPRTPPHLLLGGLYGFVIVAAAIVVIPRLGAAATFTLVVCAQLGVALALDHLGAFGLARIPISWDRMLGVGLVIVGVLLARR
jgi:transporter family-2 protein